MHLGAVDDRPCLGVVAHLLQRHRRAQHVADELAPALGIPLAHPHLVVHREPAQYNAEGSWTGCLSDDLWKMKYLPGPAGSLTIHNCRTLHYSAKNDSDLGRPLLLNQ